MRITKKKIKKALVILGSLALVSGASYLAYKRVPKVKENADKLGSKLGKMFKKNREERDCPKLYVNVTGEATAKPAKKYYKHA